MKTFLWVTLSKRVNLFRQQRHVVYSEHLYQGIAQAASALFFVILSWHKYWGGFMLYDIACSRPSFVVVSFVVFNLVNCWQWHYKVPLSWFVWNRVEHFMQCMLSEIKMIHVKADVQCYNLSVVNQNGNGF